MADKKYTYILDFATNASKTVNEITGISGALKGAAAAATALFAVDEVKNFLISSKQAYQESAMAEAALLTALKGRQSVQIALIAQATELQAKTLFDDDETVRAQSLVAAFVKEEASIKRLIPLIQDFATAKQMDLASAADLVTKTFAGQMNALGRYGIVIEGSAGSAERLESVVAGLSGHFKGQAEAAALASDGTQQLANNFENLKEQIGGAIVQSEWYKRTISELSKSVTILTSDLSFWAKINPFESQEQTYQKALVSMKKQEQAQIAAAKAAEEAAGANGKYTFSVAEEITITAKSIRSYADLKAAIGEKTAALESADMKDKNYIKTLRSEIAYLNAKKEAFEGVAAAAGKPTVKREKTESLVAMQTTGLDGFKLNPEAMEGLNLKPTLDVSNILENMPVYQENMRIMREEQEALAETALVVSGAVQFGFEQIGDSLVQSLGLAEDGFEGFLSGLLKTVTDLIAMMLAQSIANSIAGATASGAATGPAAIFTTPAFIATAIGGVMAAFAAIPKFAAGGIAYGPTVGMMGEYPGAASNPEIIAPLSKLKSLIEPAGGSQAVYLQPSIEYSPEGFRIMLNRANQKMYKRT